MPPNSLLAPSWHTDSFCASQPILADEVQTFKALITIHKVLQEGHPNTLREAMANRGWLETLNRGMTGEGMRGYGPLIQEYVYYLLAKLSFHQQHPAFNGTFEYEEYLSLKSINDPNEGFETITDLMTLQDKIEQFQKLIFSHFRNVGNNECRISALVPLVTESYGIYKFITSMLRAMHSSEFAAAPLASSRSPPFSPPTAALFHLPQTLCSHLRSRSVGFLPSPPFSPPQPLCFTPPAPPFFLRITR